MLFCELLQHEKVIWSAGGAYTPVSGITLDSRACARGSLFFCIRGARQDGHDYAMDAYRRGCRHFVAERMLSLPPDASILICPSVTKKMALIAARYYKDPGSEMLLIGVTGTKGKTTTSLMLRGLLAAVGIPSIYIGSSGVVFGDRHILTDNTTPPSVDTLRYLRAAADQGIRVAIMEVSSQALSKDRVFGFPFSFCVFTNLSRDHIGVGEHASMAEYRAAKMRLFTDFNPKMLVLNCEEPFSHDVMRACGNTSCLLYGNGIGSFAGYASVKQHIEDERLYTSFLLKMRGQEHRVALGLAGMHYVLDLLAALSTACAVSGLAHTAFLPCISSLSVPGRCEVYSAPSGALFVIDYAHNGASLGAALRGLRPYVSGRLFCLFGAVGERTACRRADMAAAAERYADHSVITSDNPGGEDAEKITEEIRSHFTNPALCTCICDREEAIYHLLGIAKCGDVVLLAGKGDEKYQILAEGKRPFCERDIIEKFGGVQKQKIK